MAIAPGLQFLSHWSLFHSLHFSIKAELEPLRHPLSTLDRAPHSFRLREHTVTWSSHRRAIAVRPTARSFLLSVRFPLEHLCLSLFVACDANPWPPVPGPSPVATELHRGAARSRAACQSSDSPISFTAASPTPISSPGASLLGEQPVPPCSFAPVRQTRTKHHRAASPAVVPSQSPKAPP